MVNVIIAGVPKNLKISQFIEFLEKNIFQEKIKISVNYIRWFKRDLKKLSLNMRSNDARKAIRYLNGYEFTSRRINYSLECWKEESEDISDNEDTFVPPSKIARTSSSFDGPDELQVIDHKIELIRKQRILLEEESLLLLQKKRLEMIQNLGPNDFQKLSKLEELSEINQSVTETRLKGKLRRPPDFRGPWKIIYETMKSVIKAYVDDQDRPILIDLLRSRVKNRLALMLKDKGNLKAKEILALYRCIHPEESDINLVQEVLVKIDQSINPIDITTKYNGEKNVQDNTTDEVNFHYEKDVEETGMKDTQNEEVAFYEDVYPDFDNNTKQETTEKELFERNLYTEKEINEDCETNIAGPENCELEVYKSKEIIQNDCNENKSNQISEETYLNIDKDTCINESEFALLNTNKQTEPAFNEVFDIDNDLDDWVEDENDQQEIKVA